VNKTWRIVGPEPIEMRLSEAIEQWAVVLHKEYYMHRKLYDFFLPLLFFDIIAYQMTLYIVKFY